MTDDGDVDGHFRPYKVYIRGSELKICELRIRTRSEESWTSVERIGRASPESAAAPMRARKRVI